jgi:hypothetical protein
MITVFNGECGSQKTTKRIFPIIQRNLLEEQPTLVVVPSIDLQMKYKSQFKQAMVINNTTIANDSSVKYEIKSNMYSTDVRLIIITHQAFLFLELHNEIKRRHELIIDESLNPFFHEELKNDEMGKCPVNWGEILYGESPFKDNNDIVLSYEDKLLITEYIDVEVLPFDDNASIISESSQLKRLGNDNFALKMRFNKFTELITSKVSSKFIYAALKPSVFYHWKCITIASAKIENSFMGMWMNSNNIRYAVKQEFTKHSKNKLFIHFPDNGHGDFSWSKTRCQENPEILAEWFDYVNRVIKTKELGRPISIKNNFVKRTLHNEVKINHNAHGIECVQVLNSDNELEDIDLTKLHAVSFASAIKPSNGLSSYFREVYELTSKQIESGLRTYNVYQLIMRSALRDYKNTNDVHIFLMDSNDVLAMFDYFNTDEQNQDETLLIEELSSIKKMITKPNPEKILLKDMHGYNAWRQKRWRQKKKEEKEHQKLIEELKDSNQPPQSKISA